MWSRLSTDGQSVGAQVRQLTKAGCKKVFREVASGAKTDRAQLRRLLDELEEGDVLSVTRLARSTRDLLNMLAAITAKKAGFKSIGDTWADTTTSHGRLMLTVLGGLAEFERDLIRAHRRRPGAGRGARAENGPTVQAHRSPKARGDQAPQPRRDACRRRPQLRRQPGDDFEVRGGVIELLNFAIAVVALVVAIVAVVIAVPPFAQMIHGPPKVRLAFDVSTEQGATLLLCAIHNLPVNSWFLRKIGVTRTPTEVFASFDIREHGTNKIIVNSFRARLTDGRNPDAMGLTLVARPGPPLVFLVVEQSDREATAINYAPMQCAKVALAPGEYFADIKVA